MTNATEINGCRYANRHGWSDVHPYEIIRVVSAQTLEVRALDAKLADDWKPEIIPGGFAGHCINQNSQRWEYCSNETCPTIRIRLSRQAGRGWRDAQGSRFRLGKSPMMYHDYNF